MSLSLLQHLIAMITVPSPSFNGNISLAMGWSGILDVWASCWNRPVREDTMPERANQKHDRANYRSERADFRLERAEFRPWRAYSRPRRLDSWWGWPKYRQMDGRTDGPTKVHCVLQEFVPLGTATYKVSLTTLPLSAWFLPFVHPPSSGQPC